MTHSPRAGTAVDGAERALLARVLDALLREDHLGLRSRGATTEPAPGLLAAGPGERWWAASVPRAGRVLLRVHTDGLFHEPAVSAPALAVVEGDGTATLVEGLAGALAVLAPAADDAEAAEGWADFTAECAAALATARLQERVTPEPATPDPAAAGRGFDGLLRHEALAALRDHPVHPTGRARIGMEPDLQRRYAPEFRPAFPLRWTRVPRSDVRLSPALAAGLPDWWPGAPDGRIALPVHPLTLRARPDLEPAQTYLEVTPTLSLRTVALVGRPDVHVKLPLPISTLGRRNRRTIRPGTLADGATMQALLADVLRREPDLARGVLLADESRWIESDDELLAVLVRRYPAEVAADDLVPLAALPAADPQLPGRTVLDRLAGGDTVGWFARYLDVLLNWHVALWLRYGIALEAHQQNIAVAMGTRGLRLIYKDNDGARLDLTRLAVAGVPVRADVLHDHRMAVAAPGELADVFVTITLHLCVGALVAACTTPGGPRRAALLELARATLEDALARWCDPADAWSVAAADELRRVLDADRWPLKAMVTSGTLLPKQRLGCTDINKHYVRTGRNYLAPRASR